MNSRSTSTLVRVTFDAGVEHGQRGDLARAFGLQGADVQPRQHCARRHRVAFLDRDLRQRAAGFEAEFDAPRRLDPTREGDRDLILLLQNDRRGPHRDGRCGGGCRPCGGTC
jgi:hypothetical protein